MKTINFLLIAMLLGIMGMTHPSAANAAEGDMTFYTSSNYRGSKKSMDPGEYSNCSNWRYRSWKVDEGCCTEITYYKRSGGYGTKKFCGSVKDFYTALRSVQGLKYGSTQGWRNVKSVRIYCEGGGDETASHKPNNNQNSNSNNGNASAKMGKNLKLPTWYGLRDFKGNTQQYEPRRYNRFPVSWSHQSVIIPRGYEVRFDWLGFGNRKKNKVLKAGEYNDLYRLFRSWGFRNNGQAYWRDMVEVYIYKEGQGNPYGAPVKDEANAAYKVQFFGSQNFKGNTRAYEPNLYTRVRAWNGRSLVIPKGVKVKFNFYGAGNRKKHQTLEAGKYANLYSVFNRWGFRSSSTNNFNPWADMYEIDIIKE